MENGNPVKEVDFRAWAGKPTGSQLCKQNRSLENFAYLENHRCMSQDRPVAGVNCYKLPGPWRVAEDPCGAGGEGATSPTEEDTVVVGLCEREGGFFLSSGCFQTSTQSGPSVFPKKFHFSDYFSLLSQCPALLTAPKGWKPIACCASRPLLTKP